MKIGVWRETDVLVEQWLGRRVPERYCTPRNRSQPCVGGRQAQRMRKGYSTRPIPSLTMEINIHVLASYFIKLWYHRVYD
jgi:hypothetical protein